MTNYFFRYDTTRKVWEVSTDGGSSFVDADQNFPNAVEFGEHIIVDTYADIGTYVDAGTYVNAGTYVKAGSFLESVTYGTIGSYLTIGTYMGLGTYIDIETSANPGVSAAGKCRLFFNGTKLKISEDGGGYNNVV